MQQFSIRSTLLRVARSPLTRLPWHALQGLLLTSLLLPTTTSAATRISPSRPTDSTMAPPPLRVSVAPSIDDAALLPTWLEERHPNLDRTLALSGHEQWLEVRIDGTTYAYQVTVTALRDGEPIAPATDPLTCECNAEALLVMLDHEIEGAVARLRATPPSLSLPASADTASPPTALPAPVSPSPSSHTAPRRWLVSPLGIAGAGAAAFGLLAIGAGTSLVVAEERQIAAQSHLYRELDPLGYTTLSIGLAALAGGIVLVVLDAVRLNRHMDHRGSRRVQVRKPHALRWGSGGFTVHHLGGATIMRRF